MPSVITAFAFVRMAGMEMVLSVRTTARMNHSGMMVDASQSLTMIWNVSYILPRIRVHVHKLGFLIHLNGVFYVSVEVSANCTDYDCTCPPGYELSEIDGVTVCRLNVNTEKPVEEELGE